MPPSSPRAAAADSRRDRARSPGCRSTRALALVIPCFACLAACAGTTGAPGVEADSLTGLELVYRFPTGRTYRARYSAETVSFVLLEPKSESPPSATMPYRAKAIREGMYLVVWDSTTYHATFLVDLEKREIHASSLREGGRRFLGTAEIVGLRAAR